MSDWTTTVTQRSEDTSRELVLTLRVRVREALEMADADDVQDSDAYDFTAGEDEETLQTLDPEEAGGWLAEMLDEMGMEPFYGTGHACAVDSVVLVHAAWVDAPPADFHQAG